MFFRSVRDEVLELIFFCGLLAFKNFGCKIFDLTSGHFSKPLMEGIHSLMKGFLFICIPSILIIKSNFIYLKSHFSV